jgi:hypothetical protein
MSRGLLVIGLILSLAAHLALLRLPAARSAPPPAPAPPPVVVPVVETALARVAPAPDPVDERLDDPETAPPEEAEPAPPDDPREPPPVADTEPAIDPPAPAPPPEPEAPAPAPDPAPDLVETAAPPAGATEQPGDFAGQADGVRQPALRIDWGSPAHAVASVAAGRMRIVVLAAGDGGPIIVGELHRDESAWRRRPFAPAAGSTRYSNRLRIVDGVPAFEAPRRDARLGSGEHLAVLVPVGLERRFESAQVEAAARRGLVMARVRSFGGRFVLDDGPLRFEITHVGEEVP